MTKTNKIIYGILGILVVLGFGLFFYTAGKNANVTRANQELQTQTLSGKLETVKATARDIEKRNEEIKKENDRLVKEYDANDAKLQSLYSDSRKLQELMNSTGSTN